jgi:hypothetical protein
MKLKALALGAVLAVATAVPGIAQAATWFGYTTGTANMRVDAYVGAPKVTTLPGHVNVRIDGLKNGWYHVAYGPYQGWVAGSLIQTRVAMQPRPFFRGPAPKFGYYHKPYWDNRYQAWYDGRRWYRNGIWYNSPSGFSFGFSFGG